MLLAVSSNAQRVVMDTAHQDVTQTIKSQVKWSTAQDTKNHQMTSKVVCSSGQTALYCLKRTWKFSVKIKICGSM